jgi:hypothetical protein
MDCITPVNGKDHTKNDDLNKKPKNIELNMIDQLNDE